MTYGEAIEPFCSSPLFVVPVLGVLRTLAIVYSPMERKMVEHLVESKQHAQHSEEKITGRSETARLFAF